MSANEVPHGSHRPGEDSQVYSRVWQQKLIEAEADLAEGRVRRFGSDNEFLAHLDAIVDQADC